MPDHKLHNTVQASSRPVWPALFGIALVVAVIGLAFAWTAGWLTPERLTPARVVNAIEANNKEIYPGYRRAHAKGICVAGYFEGNGQGVALSSARIFATEHTPFIGRMSIGGGSPHGSDATARVRSMALQLNSDDGQQWRMAMNSFPFFSVSSAEAFYEQMIAIRPDPVTGKPDATKQAAFNEAHPEAARFGVWAKNAPWPTSWANTTYYGVNTFRFINRDGETSHVRWSMQPHTAFEELSPAQRESADANFLSKDLTTRLLLGPVRWDMVVTVAEPGDSTSDPSQPWPKNRKHVTVGTVVIERSSPQTTGACRDINYDPLVLPTGVKGSDDSVLAARSAVYSVSFNRREQDIARGKADDAIGKGAAMEASQ